MADAGPLDLRLPPFCGLMIITIGPFKVMVRHEVDSTVLPTSKEDICKTP